MSEAGRRGKRRPFTGLAETLTRRGMLIGTGVVGGGFLVDRAGWMASAARQSSTVREIIDAAITAEALAVTFTGVARQRGADGKLDLGPDLPDVLRTVQCEEEAHFHFLQAAGAVPSTMTFSIPSRTFKDRTTLLRALADLEAIAVGAYMAAARAFAELGDFRLVEIAYQIGAVEAQHQALTRYLAGDRPANDRAFAKWTFRSVAEATQALVSAGYIGGAGQPANYPGPVDRVCRGVFGLVPETTEDQASPIPATPAAASPPAATPAT